MSARTGTGAEPDDGDDEDDGLEDVFPSGVDGTTNQQGEAVSTSPEPVRRRRRVVVKDDTSSCDEDDGLEDVFLSGVDGTTNQQGEAVSTSPEPVRRRRRVVVEDHTSSCDGDIVLFGSSDDDGRDDFMDSKEVCNDIIDTSANVHAADWGECCFVYESLHSNVSNRR